MKYYIIYNKATGEIEKTLQCDDIDTVNLNHDSKIEGYIEYNNPIDDRLVKVDIDNKKLIKSVKKDQVKSEDYDDLDIDNMIMDKV